jgi:transcriptional regulator with XRE-family HTH domain
MADYTGFVTSKQIGPTLKKLRKQCMLTGLALSASVGISQSKLSKIETGNILPKPEELAKILNILSVPLNIQQQLFQSLTDSIRNAHSLKLRKYFSYG